MNPVLSTTTHETPARGSAALSRLFLNGPDAASGYSPRPEGAQAGTLYEARERLIQRRKAGDMSHDTLARLKAVTHDMLRGEV